MERMVNNFSALLALGTEADSGFGAAGLEKFKRSEFAASADAHQNVHLKGGSDDIVFWGLDERANGLSDLDYLVFAESGGI